MKIKGIIFILLSVMVVWSCQPKVDPEAEKQAIIKVINDETDVYLNFDYEAVVSYFVHDSLNFRLSAGADDMEFVEGWDNIDKFYRADLLDREPGSVTDTHVTVSKDDYQIKLYDDAAYVTCTETWLYTINNDSLEIVSRQVRFMEKVDGEWKIAFLAFVGNSGYEEEVGLEEMGVEFNTAF